jgi:2-keto-3-deoxy-L-rhamnonate aldolase RhmA
VGVEVDYWFCDKTALVDSFTHIGYNSCMRTNSLRSQLGSGKPAIGTMIEEISSPFIVHVLANAGFDFVFVDMEHGRFGQEAAVNLIQTVRLTPMTCLVRVPDNQYHLIARMLDAGAEGIMVPRISTRQEVEAVVQSIRYPPIGQRGLSVTRGHNDYERGEAQTFAAHANRENLVIIQIERRKAVEDIDSLVSVPGVDVALIGPVDLSISLGLPLDYSNPDIINAIQRVVDACQRYQVIAGIHTRNLQALTHWRQRGILMLTASSDLDMVLDSSKALAIAMRELARGGNFEG